MRWEEGANAGSSHERRSVYVPCGGAAERLYVPAWAECPPQRSPPGPHPQWRTARGCRVDGLALCRARVAMHPSRPPQPQTPRQRRRWGRRRRLAQSGFRAFPLFSPRAQPTSAEPLGAEPGRYECVLWIDWMASMRSASRADSDILQDVCVNSLCAAHERWAFLNSAASAWAVGVLEYGGDDGLSVRAMAFVRGSPRERYYHCF